MKSYIKFFTLILALLVISCNEQFAQDKFTIGAFIASGPDGSTHYNNYQQVVDLGVNAVWQLAIKDVPELNQTSNYNSLSLFDFIWASNDSGTGTGVSFIDAKSQNIDWISYFTSAKYTKWEVEGEPLFEGSVRIKHEDALGTFGTPYTDGGVSGWRSGSDSENANRFLITGPDYWQYPRYTFTNASWNPTPIDYIASFNMMLGSPSTTNVPVCSLFVVMTDSDGIEHTLKSKLVTSIMLSSTDYTDITLPYNYIGFFNVDTVNQNHYSMPGSFEIQSPPRYNLGSTIEFRVQWLGNVELLVDYIEVYDQMIWENWFKDPLQKMIDSIVTYDQEFANQSPTFYNKLKYYYTMDEPHSIDGYEPLRKVQEILDTHNIQADLLTHWYPEWDGTRDGDPSWPIYKALAQPKKVMFYFTPFTYSGYNNEPTDLTLYAFKYHLQEAHSADNNFFLSAQAFGYRQNGTQGYWRLPDTSEISAETMLALAHGCKGIFYETYYTYGNINDKLVEGLVDLPTSNNFYPPRPIWSKVQQLAARLTGNLGNTLVKLNYTGDYLMLRQGVYASGETGNFTNDYLELQSGANPCNFHAGLFTKVGLNDNDYYYFLLTNQLTTYATIVNVTVKPKTSGFTNIRLRNIEGGFDVTFNSFYSLNYNFPAGEGYLFQVAPVVKYGGKLVYNETVATNTTLYDDMSVESGATLTVNGTYTANADITIKAGGKIKYGSDNSKIIFSNGAKLILEGNAQVLGLSNTNKLTLQYDASTSFGVVVNPGASPIISYCNITNPLNGISVENEATINVSNTSISNCSNTGIALFHFGNGDSFLTLSTPNIYKCSISNCGTAISAVNCTEVIIKENAIYQCNLGIYLNMVNSAYISSNTILGWQSATGSPMPGISMSSSGGYLRNNTIRYHNYGVMLAYSSPDLGVNTIEYNYKCGVYSDIGSFPNLVQQLANPTC